MDIQTIKTFAYVAKLGNFSKAAAELNYAQSTVTMQLQRLEKELGFPLFEKVGRKNYLTIAGEEFLSYAEKILHLTERAALIGRDLKMIKGIIRIGILESLLFSKFLPVLSRYKKKFPNIEVNIKIGQAEELKELVKRNKLDIIYISGGKQDDPELNCCFENKEELVFAVSATHPLASEENITGERIFDYPFVVTEPTGYCYKQLTRISADKGCMLNHNMVIDSVAAIIDLLSDGESVAFLPGYSLTDATKSNKLVTISSDIGRQFYYRRVLCAKNKWISPFAEELIAEIKK